MLRSFFNRLIDFAGEQFRREYATGGSASPSLLGFDDAEAQIAWGGAATEHPGCDGPCPDWAAGHDESHLFHVRKDAA